MSEISLNRRTPELANVIFGVAIGLIAAKGLASTDMIDMAANLWQAALLLESVAMRVFLSMLMWLMYARLAPFIMTRSMLRLEPHFIFATLPLLFAVLFCTMLPELPIFGLSPIGGYSRATSHFNTADLALYMLAGFFLSISAAAAFSNLISRRQHSTEMIVYGLFGVGSLMAALIPVFEVLNLKAQYLNVAPTAIVLGSSVVFWLVHRRRPTAR